MGSILSSEKTRTLHGGPAEPAKKDGLTGKTHGDFVLDARVHEITCSSSEEVQLLLRRNGSFSRATVTPGSVSTIIFETIRNLTVESLVRVTTTKPIQQEVADESAAISISSLEILSKATVKLPQKGILPHGAPGDKSLQPSSVSIDDRLNNRLLDARVTSTAAIFKLFSGIHELAVQFLSQHDFYHVPTPALVTYMWPGEEDDHFPVPYFENQTAWLAPTSEIHLSMALAADMQRVYDIHTVFRREPESDGRHLTEFTMLELVFAINQTWTEIPDLADALLVFLISSLQQQERYISLTQDAKRLYPRAGSFKLGLDPVMGKKLHRITFQEAKAMLRDHCGLDARDEDDLSRHEEAALGRLLSCPDSSPLSPATDIFMITHYPSHIRPCNVHPSSSDKKTTNSFDIILRGQEIVTGCQLLHSHQDLRRAFTTRKPPIDPDSPQWRTYMAAHEIGMPPWGGFGLGLNRLVQGFLGLEDIRETVLFPRDAGRLVP